MSTLSTLQERQREAVRVTLIGSALDLTLGVLKIAAGVLAGSFALISDGIHSMSDLVTDAFVLLMARIAHQEPDAGHPYGHRRFETLGTIIIGVALFVVAGLICYDALRRLGSEYLPVPGAAALAVTLLSIAGKEWIYRFSRRIADQLGSAMLLANAWHSRTDALSSVAVLIGIVGARLGYPWMDLLAALVVGLLIGWIAWKLLRDSLAELVDTALPAEEVEAIRAHILALTGTAGVHSLRSRRHAGKSFLDIHVEVDSKLSVSEGHYLGDRICRSLQDSFPDIADVLIHIDPELDREGPVCVLPLRREVIEALLERWRGRLEREDVERFVLHYLNDRIQVEVFLKTHLKDKDLRDELKKRLEGLEWLDSLRIYERS